MALGSGRDSRRGSPGNPGDHKILLKPLCIHYSLNVQSYLKCRDAYKIEYNVTIIAKGDTVTATAIILQITQRQPV